MEVSLQEVGSLWLFQRLDSEGIYILQHAFTAETSAIFLSLIKIVSMVFMFQKSQFTHPQVLNAFVIYIHYLNLERLHFASLFTAHIYIFNRPVHWS